MMKSTMAAMAIAAVVGALAVTPANAAEHMDKCFGIAKAGENGCAAGAHSCKGHSTEDFSGKEWKLVAKGTCEQMGGKLEAFEGKGTPK